MLFRIWFASNKRCVVRALPLTPAEHNTSVCAFMHIIITRQKLCLPSTISISTGPLNGGRFSWNMNDTALYKSANFPWDFTIHIYIYISYKRGKFQKGTLRVIFVSFSLFYYITHNLADSDFSISQCDTKIYHKCNAQIEETIIFLFVNYRTRVRVTRSILND